MKRDLQASPTYIPRERGSRWFGKGYTKDTVAVDLPDGQLRRIGHLEGSGSSTGYTREEFRTLKRRVLAEISEGANKDTRRNPRLILVSSACPNDGKTFVALNLALSLAIDPTFDVTLIDADTVTQGLSDRLGLANAPGLHEALTDRGTSFERYLSSTNIRNLRIVPSGAAGAETGDLLSSHKLAALLADLVKRSAQSVVVLDSSALLSGSSAVALAPLVGQILFVIAANQTGRADIEQSLAILDGAIGPLDEAKIGLVLNRIRPSQSAARYLVRR